MDRVEHLTKDTQPKFSTRSTARHLRRKRLNEARRAEKQLSGLASISDTSVEQQSQVNKPNNSKTEVLTKSKARRLRKKEKLQENCYNNEYYVYAGLYNYTTANKYDSIAYNKSDGNVADLKFSSALNLNSVQTLLSSADQTHYNEPLLAQIENCCNKSDCDTIHNCKQKVDAEKISRSQICDGKSDDTGYGKRLKRIGRKSLNIESEEDSSDLSRSSDSPFWLSNIEENIRWEVKDGSSLNSESSSVASKSENAQARCRNYDENFDVSEIRLSNSTTVLKDSVIRVNPSPTIDHSDKEKADNSRSNSTSHPDVTSLNECIKNTSSQKILLLDEQEAINDRSKTIEPVEHKTKHQSNRFSTDNNSTVSQLMPEIVDDSESLHCDNKVLDVITTQRKSGKDEPLIACASPMQTEEILVVPNSSIVKDTLNESVSDSKTIAKMFEIKSKVQEKTREEIKAEREAKKAAKAAAKAKVKGAKAPAKDAPEQPPVTPDVSKKPEGVDQIDTASAGPGDFMKRMRTSIPEVHSEIAKQDFSAPASKLEVKSKAVLRAERRAKQEAQRAAKQESSVGKVKSKTSDAPIVRAQISAQAPVATGAAVKKMTKKVVPKEDTHEVNLFKHLYHERELALVNVPVVNTTIHPAIVRLGVQYENKVIMGSNARCIALLAAVKQLIQDFERPSQADFIRGLEASLQECAAYLHHCRPLAVSMQNALRHLKWQMTQLPSSIADKKAKEKLESAIDTYILEQIELAGKAISITIQTKISNGNVILTYGYSSLIHKILLDAHLAGKQFRVIVVDGRPWLEGKEQLRRLAKHGIECSYVLINALSYVMPEVSKVFLGAHAILANGAVMSRVGTAQVALMARAFNVPVLVACETHKSCERVQTDSIVYNELGDAEELTRNFLSNGRTSVLSKWRTKKHLNLLNITYDVTPADLVTAVVTELAILPCTSVPVILRIKPSEL